MAGAWHLGALGPGEEAGAVQAQGGRLRGWSTQCKQELWRIHRHSISQTYETKTLLRLRTQHPWARLLRPGRAPLAPEREAA